MCWNILTPVPIGKLAFLDGLSFKIAISPTLAAKPPQPTQVYPSEPRIIPLASFKAWAHSMGCLKTWA